MTFKHTLSRRLALLRDAVTVAALAVLASCDLFSPVDSGLEVAQLLVTPGSATLPTSGTQAFVAYARLKHGDSVAVTVAWSATGGSISSAGVYTAGLTTGEYTVTATGKGFTSTATVTLTSIPVASVSVSPTSATLSLGATQQLSAVTKDAAGNTLTGRVVTWSSSNPMVATVSGSGLVTAVAAGSATITATSEGKNGTSAITVQAPPPETHGGYYVAPTGSPTGDGSVTRPWNLATALAHPTAVQPGDTIWLRGGTYPAPASGFTSSLTGTSARPIILRQYPGERATLDGAGTAAPTLTVNGAWTWYWGFEVINSVRPYQGPVGVNTFGTNVKLINLVVHDAGGTGIGFWIPSTNSEIYGCILYNNGTWDNRDHGIYSQNQTGIKQIRENVIFNNYAFGVHIYASSVALVGFVLDGNVSFTNSSIGEAPGVLMQRPGILVGGDTPADDITVTNNMLYMRDAPAATNLWVGYSSSLTNGDVVVTGNYVAGGYPAFRFWEWTTAEVRNNTLYNPTSYLNLLNTDGATGGWTWTNQMHHVPPATSAWFHNGSLYTFANWKTQTGLGASDQTGANPPTGVKVFVRPNAYEPGRGHVIVYNWDHVSSVAVDVSSVLAVGSRYEVRNVENVFGAPVMSGTYQGGTLNFPMSAVAPPTPINGSAPPATGPEFQVFLITRP